MAYQANIPQATDKLRISQADLLNNFIAIDSFVSANHYGFASGNVGKHLYLQMPETAAPATAANEAGLYANNGTISGTTELFFRRESNGSSIGFTEANLATTGWTKLPSGLILKWGNGTVGANADATVTFDGVGVAAFTTVYSVNCTINGGTGGLDKGFYYKSYTTTTLTVYNANANGGNRNFFYMVVGA